MGDAEEYIPGAASLKEQLNKRILVVLRGGRKIIGRLRTYDQFEAAVVYNRKLANLGLEDTVERIYVDQQYGDIARGFYIVRGESIMILGEIDEGKSTLEKDHEAHLNDILIKQYEEQEQNKHRNKLRRQAMLNRGLQLQSDPLFGDLLE